jgi:hypothetical protein
VGECAIDIAMKGYLSELQNKCRIADDFLTEIIEEPHISHLPPERETNVGYEDSNFKPVRYRLTV